MQYSNEYFYSTYLTCVKCNNYVNISLSREITQDLLNDLVNNFLCVGCNNHAIDNQHMIFSMNSCLTKQHNKFTHSMTKIYGKINNIHQLINDEKKNDVKNFKDINSKICFLKIQVGLDKHFTNKKLKEYEENFNKFKVSNENDFKIIEQVLNDNNDHINKKYEEFLSFKDNYTTKINEISKFDIKLKMRFNSLKLQIFQLEKIKKSFESEIKDYFHKLNEELIQNKNEVLQIYEDKKKELIEQTNNYYMKNKDLKELKRSLILNDKEYKVFKAKIKNIDQDFNNYFIFCGVQVFSTFLVFLYFYYYLKY